MKKSPGEVYERSLGRDFGRVYYGVKSSWAWAVVRRNEYRALYSNIEYFETMNSLAGHFFGVMQSILWDDLLLCVTRLTDPPKAQEEITLVWLNCPVIARIRNYARR